ncbi:MAG: hypothetical protein K2X35_07530 [Bryobacteraceae bacterium]|nr:hypothetical protein [Bryobacteraceae bacterium]
MTGVLVGIACELLLALSFRASANACVIVAVSVYFSKVWLYVRFPERVRSQNTTATFRRRSLLAAYAGSVIIFLNTSAPRRIQAAAIDRKLRQLTQKVPLDFRALSEVKRVLTFASQGKVHVSSEVLDRTRTVLRETAATSPELQRLALSAGTVLVAGQTLQLSHELMEAMRLPRSRPEFAGAAWKFQPIATNVGPDNYRTLPIERSPKSAIMQRIESKWEESPSGPTFLIVSGLQARLDGFHLRRIIFENMDLVYSGGPLLLDHVYFVNTRITVEPGPGAWDFIAAFRPGEPVSFGRKVN